MKSGKFKLDARDVFYIHNEVQKPVEVVLLNGIRHTAKMWDDTGTLRMLADNGYSAMSINLPQYIRNYGYDSDLQPDVWLREVYNKLHILKPILVCPSSASECALPFAIKHPSRISAFVGVAPVDLKKYRAGYPRMAIPVLAIWGEHDNVVPTSDGKNFISAVPMGEYREIENIGHNPQVENPSEFNEILLDFISKNV